MKCKCFLFFSCTAPPSLMSEGQWKIPYILWGDGHLSLWPVHLGLDVRAPSLWWSMGFGAHEILALPPATRRCWQLWHCPSCPRYPTGISSDGWEQGGLRMAAPAIVALFFSRYWQSPYFSCLASVSPPPLLQGLASVGNYQSKTISPVSGLQIVWSVT